MPPTTRTAIVQQPVTRREQLALLALGVVVLMLVVLRASMGHSFYDDTFYAVVPWRFAHGARFLIDELSFQTPAEMISVPLVWIWERLFGLTGLVLAIRLLWVALATACVALALRLLRGTARLAVAAIAVVVPLLAPAYNVFAPTYNTLASLLLTLATLAAFAALRNRSPSAALGTGALVALGVAAYPPLAPAALVLLGTFALLVREWRLVWRAGAAAAVVGGALALALLGGVHLADVRAALALGSANVASFATPAAKFEWVFGNTGRALFANPWLLPMWALALAACFPRLPARVRAAALALVPAAAALPGALLLARGDHLTFGTSTQSWLFTSCAALLLPSLLAAWRLGRRDLLQLAALAAPFAVVGYLTIAYVTNSSWNRAMPVVALAPLATAILLAWATSLAEDGGSIALGAGSVLTLAVVFALLFTNAFGDDAFPLPLERVPSGAYAGLLTSPSHVRSLAELAERSPRWVKPGARVTFLGQAEAYLAVGGEPLTPAAWLFLGRADSAGLRYFERVGKTPDVVFVSDSDVAYAGGWAKAPAHDPMLAWVLGHYRRVDTAGGFGIFARR